MSDEPTSKSDEEPTLKASSIKPTEADESMKTNLLKAWSEDRSELLTWRPFLGILAMNLELIPVVDHRCMTACTDGSRIFFNPYFLDSLNDDERMTILAHEIWHCGLLHFTREVGRIDDHRPWNYAIDHEVNTLLSEDGFELPRDCVLYEQHKGLSAEQIFEKLMSGELSLRGEVMDDHLSDSPNPQEGGHGGHDGNGTGSGTTPDTGQAESQDIPEKYGPLVIEGEEGVELKIDKNFTPKRSDDVWKDWRAKMMAAAQQCESRGHEMGNYGALLEELSASKMPWKEILRQFLTPMFGGARQWLPPNRRYISQGIYLPSRRQQELLKIVVAIDTSGSTTGAIVQSFMSEVNAIVNLFGGYEMTLLQIDAGIQDERLYTEDNPFDPDDFQLMGGGGTKFEPAFDYIKDEMNDDVKALIYMTDGYGSAPENPPPYPVIWVLSEYGRKPSDWGIELQIPPSND
jgi:predicted metal-dependent peptidase